MKAVLLATSVLMISLSAHAKCVVEIMNNDGDPLGLIFQDKECDAAMKKCKAKLPSVNVRGAKCEITLDIPGAKDGSLTYVNLP